MRLDVKSETELQQRAQTGDIEAIAYWLNLYLLPQQQCARVAQLSPGYLDVHVRCHHAPSGDLLLQVLHARLSRLGIPNLQGAKVQISMDRPYPHVLEERFLVFQPPSPPKQTATITTSNQHQYSHSLSRRFYKFKRYVTARWAAFQAQPSWQALLSSLDSFSPTALAANPPKRWKRSHVLAGAAIATFLGGCAYEVLTYYGTSPLRASSNLLPSVPVPFLSRSDRSLPKASETVNINGNEMRVYPVPTTTRGNTLSLVFTPGLNLDNTEGSIDVLNQADLILTAIDTPEAPRSPFVQTKVSIAHLSEQLTQQMGTGATARMRNTLEWQGFYTTTPSKASSSSAPPLLLEAKGQKIAFLSYGVPSADAETLNSVQERLRVDLQSLRAQVDWVVVTYDSGSPLAAYPSDWQLKFARLAVAEGADVVVGYNPTIVQGAEHYENGAIAYSLGHLEVSSTDDQSGMPGVPVTFHVQLRGDRPVQADLVPLTAETSLNSVGNATDPHSITLYLEQASGLFEHPIPESPEPEPSSKPGSSALPPENEGRSPRSATSPSVESETFTSPSQPSRENSSPAPEPFVTYPDGSPE